MSYLLASFIACAVYALLSETHIVDGFKNSEVIKNAALIISLITSLVVLLIMSFRKKDEKSNVTSPQHFV